MEVNQILHGNVIEKLLDIPDGFFNTIVTSPPYYALRKYLIPDTDWPEVTWQLFGIKITTQPWTGQLGLEQTPHDFIGHLIHIFRLSRRTLKDDGTLFINLGDSYWGGKGKSGQSYSSEYQNERYNAGRSFNGAQHQIGGKKQTRPTDQKHPYIKPKDMVGIPWMFAFAMREDGWYLRQDIIWSKPNAMPESVYDRCTKSHEYIFLFSKSHQYYFDSEAIKEQATGTEDANGFRGGAYVNGDTFDNSKGGKRKTSGNKRRITGQERSGVPGAQSNMGSSVAWEGNTRNKRSVWTVAVRPFKEAHYATFPKELIVDCIKAGCPPGGVVGDLFGGAATTALVAAGLGRNWLLIELGESYINDIATPRLKSELGLFY